MLTRSLRLWCVAGIVWFTGEISARSAAAQLAGGAGGFGQAGQASIGTGGVGAGGIGTGGVGQGGAVGGILIDAEGVVQPRFVTDKGGAIDRRRRAALSRGATAEGPGATSPLRKVSLVRLEAACEPFARDGGHVTQEMQYLAGLQRIDYVFVDLEHKDVVIAGPAEGFAHDAFGRALGVASGRPPIRLDDLMTALRSVGQRGGTIGCSIDPSDANLAKLQAFLKQTAVAMSPEDARAKLSQLGPILGRQQVRVFGIPDNSHFAHALVEADYRMKRMSLGVDPAPIKGFRSHLAFSGAGENNMQRWWFAPLYDAFVAADDGLAYAFAGPRVQLMAQEELVSDAGRRSNAPFTHVSSKKFARQFTDRYEEITQAAPAFAELQNLFDLAVLAALMRKEHIVERIAWPMTLFLDAARAPLATFAVPKEVESLSNFKVASGRLYIAQVGGGVTIDPQNVLLHQAFERTKDHNLATTRVESLRDSHPAEHPWWWD